MLARGDIHSFGPALARDELARLLECGAGLDFGAASLLIEHLELYGRQSGMQAPLPLPQPSHRRPALSFLADLCDLLLRAARWGARSAYTYRGMRS